MIFLPENEIWFPDPEESDEEGLVAAGGRLDPDWLLAAYSKGIFPWFSFDEVTFWFSPDPRLILLTDDFHIPHGLKPLLRKHSYKITLDNAFAQVIGHCATVQRNDEYETWISPEFISAYTALHQAGYAHSVEVWSGEKLVGGLYGISIGKMFSGESMFFLESGASKIALVCLVKLLKQLDFHFLDSQQVTNHLMMFGAKPVPRADFLRLLQKAIQEDGIYGSWSNFGNYFESKPRNDD